MNACIDLISFTLDLYLLTVIKACTVVFSLCPCDMTNNNLASPKMWVKVMLEAGSTRRAIRHKRERRREPFPGLFSGWCWGDWTAVVSRRHQEQMAAAVNACDCFLTPKTSTTFPFCSWARRRWRGRMKYQRVSVRRRKRARTSDWCHDGVICGGREGGRLEATDGIKEHHLSTGILSARTQHIPGRKAPAGLHTL